MLSFEIHNAIIPPAPAPVPMPYLHPSFLGHGILSNKAKFSGSPDTISKGMVQTGFQKPMLQGTCCGYFDPHIGNLANVLLPVIILFSASKSVFVSGTVQINGSPPSTAALVIMNLNLNCFFPVSMPVGVVYAFNTVQAGMSIGDYMAGVAAMAIQMIIEKIVGSAISGIGGSRMASNFMSRAFIRSVTPNMHVATPFARFVAGYLGSSPIVAGLITREVAQDVGSGVSGYVMDQIPQIEQAQTDSTRAIGSGVDSF